MQLDEKTQFTDGDGSDDGLLGMTEREFKSMTFDTFDEIGQSSSTTDERVSLELAYSTAKDFADQPRNWLYLHGPTGVGKTHLAAAIANCSNEKGEVTTFRYVPELLDRMRQTLSRPNSGLFYDRFGKLLNAPLLILDDFIQGYMTDWALETINRIVVHRHQRRLPTVITSQYILWPGAIDHDWDRIQGKRQWASILSRLNDSSVVTERLMAAPDYRNRGA